MDLLKSFGSVATSVILTIWAKVTMSDVAAFFATVSALVSTGYHLNKWYKLRKSKNYGENKTKH